MINHAFADWAHASLKGDSVRESSSRRVVVAVGSSLSRVAGGDAFDRDMAKAISEPQRLSAELYGRYFDASALVATGRCEAAQPVLERLIPDLDRAKTPVAF